MFLNRTRWQITAILVLAAIPRIYGLGISEFHGDEVMIVGRSIALCGVPSNPVNLGILLAHIHPPVEIIVPIPFLLSLGVTEFTARLPFALAGIGSVYLIYRVATSLFSEKIGVLAALLLCFCGFHLMFSRTVMATSIELMLVLFATSLLIEAVDNPRSDRRIWVILGVSLGLCLLTQYQTLLLFPAIVYFLTKELGFSWWKGEDARLAITALFLTAIPFFVVYFSAPIFFPQIGPTLGANYILRRGLGELGFHGLYYLKSLVNYCSIFYLLLLAFGLLLSLRLPNDKRVRFCWIWLLSFLVPFLFFMRGPVVVYLMDGIPPMLILTSIGLTSLRTGNSTKLNVGDPRSWFLPLLVCSVILLSSFHAYNYTIRFEDDVSPSIITLHVEGSHYRPHKFGWKTAGWFVRENTRGSDLYVSDGEGFVTRYYTNRRYLCEIWEFFDCLNTDSWKEVRLILLSYESRESLPEIWRYVQEHYSLIAVVRFHSSDRIFIFDAKLKADSFTILRPEVFDQLFDRKYGASTDTILDIYV